MKLNGWIRLGIVITLSWLITISSWCYFDFHSNTRKDTILIEWDNNKPKPWEIDWDGEAAQKAYVLSEDKQEGYIFDIDEYLKNKGMTQSEIYQIPITAEIKLNNFLSLLFLPPFLIWIIGFSIAWIKSGFKKE